MNFLRRLALQEEKKLDDSSRLDVAEIARSLTCFRGCFLPCRAKDLSALTVSRKFVLRSFLQISSLVIFINFVLFTYLICLLNYLLIWLLNPREIKRSRFCGNSPLVIGFTSNEMGSH